LKLKKILLCAIAVISCFLVYEFFFTQSDPKLYAQNLLAQADIKINGSRPWDMQVHNEKLYARVISQGSIGLGESYMDGWWDAQALDQFFYKLLSAELDQKVGLNWTTVMTYIKSKLINMQSKSRAFEVGERHYDLGNQLFEKMLDNRMVYSCGYWCKANSLDEAQENKLDLLCKKLQLKPGMKMLDIGCGWGGLAYWAAKNYGVSVTGITVSKEQAEYACKNCADLPVNIVLQDYRDVQGKFDRVVSVGMFEHVGYKNYDEFMSVAHRSLKDDGLFLLHTIGNNVTAFATDPWINKYIFPNGMLPSMKQISASAEGKFVIEDWHNFGADYDKTLMAWHQNFDQHWDQLKSQYDERFYRMWKYYLLSCAGLFRSRQSQLWQVVMSKKGVAGGYISVR
jgi:cyclopropane-fatty-acyl-phospholipid synthase